ncbi:MAG: lipocalin-like domain-containing protein [Gemmatimonadaceae bacterium]
MRRWLVAVIVLGACAPTPPISRPASDSAEGRPSAASLVGTWRVVKFCEDDSTGQMTYPSGETPIGYFIYAPDGTLSVQVSEGPPPPPFVHGDDHPTDREREHLLKVYFGYFGTYTITSDSTVIHHVQGGTFPSYNGTEQARVYRIRGDSLTIGSSQVTWPCRLLLRVRSSDTASR